MYFGSTPLIIVNQRKKRKGIVDARLFDRILKLYFYERMSLREIADVLGVSHMTVYRALNNPETEVLI